MMTLIALAIATLASLAMAVWQLVRIMIMMLGLSSFLGIRTLYGIISGWSAAAMIFVFLLWPGGVLEFFDMLVVQILVFVLLWILTALAYWFYSWYDHE